MGCLAVWRSRGNGESPLPLRVAFAVVRDGVSDRPCALGTLTQLSSRSNGKLALLEAKVDTECFS